MAAGPLGHGENDGLGHHSQIEDGNWLGRSVRLSAGSAKTRALKGSPRLSEYVRRSAFAKDSRGQLEQLRGELVLTP